MYGKIIENIAKKLAKLKTETDKVVLPRFDSLDVPLEDITISAAPITERASNSKRYIDIAFSERREDKLPPLFPSEISPSRQAIPQDEFIPISLPILLTLPVETLLGSCEGYVLFAMAFTNLFVYCGLAIPEMLIAYRGMKEEIAMKKIKPPIYNPISASNPIFYCCFPPV
ncbi:MAG: hypothetical protein RAK22_00490 [Nanoarchaeota archaeon]|nr:hypothetical protein [Nanoarchaeota archaeon]